MRASTVDGSANQDENIDAGGMSSHLYSKRKGGPAAVPTTYNHSGTQQFNTHLVFDTVQLSGGTVGVTLTGSAVFNNAFVCTATDNTNPDAVQVSTSGGNQIAFKGNGNDFIGYVCVGD
jgi:hypothetical protein